jgi:tetratricopeptide (TPR) repeat protein
MSRFSLRTFALASFLLLLPAAGWAQKEPAHTKETKNAEKFIGLAMTRQDEAEKRQFLERALTPLREAAQKNPDNGRVWLMAGSVYAGLGQFVAADSAFDRALQLYPPYAEQIDTDRHYAWEAAFNIAVGLINQQKTEEGIQALETAELLYEQRPEAKFYLGLLYNQKGETEKAEQALRATIAAANGPLRAKLPPEGAQEWERMAANARGQLSNVTAMRAAALYDAGKYNEAAGKFAEAHQSNPASRDHLFNQLQSVYAQALELDKQREGTKSSTLNQQTHATYTEVLKLTESLRAIDPRNEDIYFFSSRAHKVLSELASDAAGKAKHMEALRTVNTEYEQLPFLIDDVQIAEGENEATVKGNLVKRKLQGNTASIVFELIGYDGQPIGSAPITIAVPASGAADTKIAFDAKIPTTAGVAGWRYKLQ